MPSDVLEQHRRDWEELAGVDPAILASPERRWGRWKLDDFLYSALVLHHLPRKDIATAYLGEFVRLRPGGLAVFKTLSHLPLRRRFQPRRRAYALLHRAGLRHEFLLSRLKLVPVRLATISEEEVRSAVEARGGIVVHVEEHPERTDEIRSLRYYVRV